MPIRSVVRAATPKGYALPDNAPIYVDSDDNQLKVIPAGTGSTEVPVMLGGTAVAKIVGGTGALVTGTLLIATGLSQITAAWASQREQPTGTGTASMQILVPTWATGGLTVTAYSVASVTGGTAAASTSTGAFSWGAIGTP